MFPFKYFAIYAVTAASYIGFTEYKDRSARAETEQKLHDYFHND